MKNSAQPLRSAGNKDDRFDAYVLADTLRTDRNRLRPLVPDGPATVALRTSCRARKELIGHRVSMANQLREHLNRAFPGAVGMFAELDSPISLAFLTRFDCEDRADWLTPKRLGTWLAKVGYTGGKSPTLLHARFDRRAPRCHRRTRHRPLPPHHPRTGRYPERPRRTDQGPLRTDRRPTRHARRCAHLHQPAPIRKDQSRKASRRSRRLPRPIPHPRGTGMPGRRRPLHPPIGHHAFGRIPMVVRQTPARRRHRLRRRLPPRQPLGRPWTAALAPSAPPPPRRAHPGPRRALRHGHRRQHGVGQPLPGSTPRPPSTPARRTTRRLTQGYSSPHSARALLDPFLRLLCVASHLGRDRSVHRTR